MPKTRRKVQRRKQQEYCTYCIRVTEWEAPYSVSLNNIALWPGTYWEFSSINIKGEIVYPQKIAGRELELDFIGSREMTASLSLAPKDDLSPKNVGTITIRGNQQRGLLVIPFDAFPLVTGLLALGMYKYVILNGYALYRGQADINSINFEKTFDEEVWG